jgi:hypothetical protein
VSAARYAAKAAFHVLYRLKVAGNPDLDRWRDYFGRPMTYMAACEKANELEGLKGAKYDFKVQHQKLVNKAA